MLVTEMSLYHIEHFTVFDKLATDRCSNKDSKDLCKCSVVHYSVLNRLINKFVDIGLLCTCYIFSLFTIGKYSVLYTIGDSLCCTCYGNHVHSSVQFNLTNIADIQLVIVRCASVSLQYLH